MILGITVTAGVILTDMDTIRGITTVGTLLGIMAGIILLGIRIGTLPGLTDIMTHGMAVTVVVTIMDFTTDIIRVLQTTDPEEVTAITEAVPQT